MVKKLTFFLFLFALIVLIGCWDKRNNSKGKRTVVDSTAFSFYNFEDETISLQNVIFDSLQSNHYNVETIKIDTSNIHENDDVSNQILKEAITYTLCKMINKDTILPYDSCYSNDFNFKSLGQLRLSNQLRLRLFIMQGKDKFHNSRIIGVCTLKNQIKSSAILAHLFNSDFSGTHSFTKFDKKRQLFTYQTELDYIDVVDDFPTDTSDLKTKRECSFLINDSGHIIIKN